MEAGRNESRACGVFVLLVPQTPGQLPCRAQNAVMGNCNSTFITHQSLLCGLLAVLTLAVHHGMGRNEIGFNLSSMQRTLFKLL